MFDAVGYVWVGLLVVVLVVLFRCFVCLLCG